MEELYDKIEKYLNDELSPAERREFEDALAQDPELAQELSLQRQLHQALSDTGEWKLRQILEQIKSDPPPPNTTTKPPGKPFWWMIPVLIGAAIVALLYLLPAETESPDLTTPSLNERPEATDTLPASTSDTSLSRPLDETPPEAVTPPDDSETVNPPSSSTPPVIATRDPAAANPALESLVAEVSNIKYDFDVLATYGTESPDRLAINGVLYAVELPADSTFYFEVFDNRPAAYPDSPVHTGRFRPELAEQSGNIAFGPKQSFAVNHAEAVQLAAGKHYLLVRLAPGSAVLKALAIE